MSIQNELAKRGYVATGTGTSDIKLFKGLRLVGIVSRKQQEESEDKLTLFLKLIENDK